MKAPLEPIVQIFKQLETENAYVKVVGNPIFSVQALLNQEIQDLDPQSSSLNSNGLLNLKNIIELMADQVAKIRWWRPRKIQKVVEDLDQAALNWATNDGYLPNAPEAVVVPEKNIFNQNRMPAFYVEMTDEIRMISDDKGDLNLDEHIKRWSKKKSDVPAELGISAAEKNPAITRLMVLFHEASHHVFSHTPNPFVAPGGFDHDTAAVLNKWIFNHNIKSNVARKAFNEIFADTYSAIMTLRGLNFSQEAIEVIREFAVLRIHMDAIKHLSEKESWMEVIHKKANKNEKSVHVGGEVVLNLLDTIDQWKDLPTDELKDLALKLSSKGLVDWLAPKSIDIRIEGKRQKLVKTDSKVKKLLGDDMPKFDKMVSICLENDVLYASPRSEFFHPCRAEMSTVAQWIKPHLKDNPKKSMKGDGIFSVLFKAVSAGLSHDFALKKVKQERAQEYQKIAAQYDEKSQQAQKVIEKGFEQFYKNQKRKKQLVSLKGRASPRL